MQKLQKLKAVALFVAATAPLVLTNVAFAADADITTTQNFIKNIIKIASGFAGLIAAGYFVVGGFTYITSSGHPEKLDKAKNTLVWSAVGMFVVGFAFVFVNIIYDQVVGSAGK